MKRKYFVLLPLLILTACNKDNKKQYSTWYVNGEMFRTNDVKLTKGKALHIFDAKNYNNGFVIQFNLGYFPTEGRYLIDCRQANPEWCCMSINYNGIGYINPKVTYLNLSTNNKKFRYTLEPTWFFNSYKMTEDSIWVKGEFNEP